MAEEYRPSEGPEPHDQDIPEEEWMTDLLSVHNLTPESSSAEIEAVAAGLWEDRTTKLDSIALILRRRIGTAEIAADHDIQSAFFAPDAATAVTRAMNKRSKEILKDES